MENEKLIEEQLQELAARKEKLQESLIQVWLLAAELEDFADWLSEEKGRTLKPETIEAINEMLDDYDELGKQMKKAGKDICMIAGAEEAEEEEDSKEILAA